MTALPHHEVLRGDAPLESAAVADLSVVGNKTDEQNPGDPCRVLDRTGDLELATAAYKRAGPEPVPVGASAVNALQKAIKYGTGGIAAELNTALGWPGFPPLCAAQVAL